MAPTYKELAPPHIPLLLFTICVKFKNEPSGIWFKVVFYHSFLYPAAYFLQNSYVINSLLDDRLNILQTFSELHLYN